MLSSEKEESESLSTGDAGIAGKSCEPLLDVDLAQCSEFKLSLGDVTLHCKLSRNLIS